MKEEILKLILDKITTLDAKEPFRQISANAGRLATDFLSKRQLQIRNGKLTDYNGVLVDLTGDLKTLIDASYYIPMNKSERMDQVKFISKWARPSDEQKKKNADEVESVLKKLSELNSIVPADQARYDQAIWVVAKNFLHERNEQGEVIFRKYNESGLLGERAYKFEDILQNMKHLVDDTRTTYARELREAERRGLASKLVGDIPKERTKNSIDAIGEKLAFIKKNEILSSIPAKKLPQIPRREVETEIIRRESVLRNKDFNQVITGGGQQLADLQRVARTEYNNLDDTSEIQKQIQVFQPLGPPRVEGISYQD